METPEGSATSTGGPDEGDRELRALLESAKRSDSEGEQAAYASLLVAARVAGDVRYTAEALDGLGGVLLRRIEFEAAQAVLSEAVAIWERLGEESRSAGSGLQLGVALQHASNHGAAFVELRRALDRFRAAGDPVGVARCTGWLGVVSAQLLDFEAAVEYHLEALRSGEALNDDRMRGVALNRLGLVHWKLGEADEAMRCFETSLEYRRSVEDPLGEADTLSNLGMLCDERGDHESALEHYFRSLHVRGESERDPNRANTLSNIGNAYSAQGAFDRALEFYAQALAMRERLGGAPLASSHQNLGALYLKMGRLEESKRHLERAEALAVEFDLRDEQRQILELRSECSECSGDLVEALDLLRRAQECERLIFRAEAARRIAEMRARYEAEQKEKEAEIFRLENVELAEANRKLEAALATATDHARRDPLTGLANRREMLERIQDEIDRFVRHDRTFSLVLFDLDRFKRVNDAHGHDVGDAMLVAMADLLRAETRIEDRVCRWGGEEFLVLLPDTDGEGATVFAERFRANVENRDFDCLEAQVRVTVSAGLSSFHPGDSISGCVKRADEALYRSKEAGRNRVILGAAR